MKSVIGVCRHYVSNNQCAIFCKMGNRNIVNTSFLKNKVIALLRLMLFSAKPAG